MISYDLQQTLVIPRTEFSCIENTLQFCTPNFQLQSNRKKENRRDSEWDFTANPLSFEEYLNKFNKVQSRINAGDTYLLNLTAMTPLDTNLSLQDIYQLSNAKYKLLLEDEFVVFSPETFIQIQDQTIKTYPMKGTIDADLPNAVQRLTDDPKEMAEHASIVDLLRNDLGKVSKNVVVNRFRYFDYVATSKKNLWQVSSEIEGLLPTSFNQNLGNIIFDLLPAGSITGVPKMEAVSIIDEIEDYNRGFYTGIFGYFDGFNLDSAVMIRFIEQHNQSLIYKSGGGIHSLSNAFQEYEELIQKIYVPIPRNHMSQK